VSVALFALALCASNGWGDMNQFWLAAQHDWGNKRGFFLNLHSDFAAGSKATLDTLRLSLGVGDGNEWHILPHAEKWELGKAYKAKAVITPTEAQLWLDGKMVTKRAVKIARTDQPLAINEAPSFLRGPSEYAVRQTRIDARAQGGSSVSASFNESTLSPQLRNFNPSAGAERKPFAVDGETVIEADFVLVRAPDLRELAPFVDRYGQSIHAAWPAKVTRDEQLHDADREELRRFAQWGEPTGRDRYGGTTRAGWKEKSTGRFRVTKRGDTWWLITPDGNPCFYIGLCDAPAVDWEATPVTGREFLFDQLPQKGGEFAPALRVNPWGNPAESDKTYLAPHTVNLIRKYGQSWADDARDSAIRRARVLGFSGFGKWTPQGGVKGVSDVAVLQRGEIPSLVRHPDVFDEEIRAQWAALFKRQIEPRKNDSYLIGWSVGNEFDENIGAADVVKIMAMGDDVPARRALYEHALKQSYNGDEVKLRAAWKDGVPPAGDVERMRRFYADAYYRFIYETVKSIDASHLYLGMWVTPNWWENEADWDLIAPHCDVIGYDHYAKDFAAEPVARLMAKYDMPVLCGEFSCPPDYAGQRGFGRYPNSSTTEAESGDHYAKWLDAAARNPKCVGVFYFQYRDQPITGRGPLPGPATDLVHGENFAFGIVDVTDRIKWEFAQKVRDANLRAAETRLNLADK
jgi:hypothetical protein